MIGKIFHNRYEILDVLGTGGTSIVYKGKDTILNRLVTLKILREQYASDGDFVRRFRHEAQAVACLSHPNIVRIYDVVFEGESHYLVMEYVEGCSLKEYIEANGQLSFEQSLKITAQLLSALSHAHEHSVIHRDIKPHNILLDTNLNVKVTDFGIAVAISDITQTYTKDVVGSVHYMSPEQVKGSTVEAASDIYSVGVVLYELLTGVQPFGGENAIGVAMQHIQGELVPPHKINPKISLGLSAVIMKAMRKDPELRYASANEMLDALRNAKLSNSPEDVDEYEKSQSEVPYQDNSRPIKQNGNLGVGFNDGLMRETMVTGGSTGGPQLQPGPRKVISADPKSNNKFFVGKKPTKKGWIAIGIGVGALVVLISLITIATSLFGGGSKDVEVPILVDMTLEQAEEVLTEAKLAYSVTREYDEEIEVDKIISQDIPAGQIVKEGRVIQLVVSQGIEEIEVPDLLGSSLRQATLSLTNIKLQITSREVVDDTVPAGQVISQSPTAGQKVGIDSTVEVVISKGRQVTVPDLVGLTSDQAKAKLAESKMLLGGTSKKESTEFVADIVLSQSPKSGGKAGEGSEVSLVISSGPGPSASKARVNYTLPEDENAEEHSIKIVVTDIKGSHDEYSGKHYGGETVTQDVSFYVKGTVQVLMDGEEVYKQEVSSK